MTERQQLLGSISDSYKDEHGFRPDSAYWRYIDADNCPLESLRNILRDLGWSFAGDQGHEEIMAENAKLFAAFELKHSLVGASLDAASL